MALIVLGVIGMFGVVAFTGFEASRESFEYRCIVEGPFRTSPPFALLSEAVEVRGYFSLWPLGRACYWERADGQGFVTALPGWGATVAFLICLALAVAGRILIDLRG
jgi:hypothetical protein